MNDQGTATSLLGRSASGSVVHIESGGIEAHRALCGARIAVYYAEAANCPRCLEKATAYGLCDDKRCEHPQGWHRHGTGSCLECGCQGFKERRVIAREAVSTNIGTAS